MTNSDKIFRTINIKNLLTTENFIKFFSSETDVFTKIVPKSKTRFINEPYWELQKFDIYYSKDINYSKAFDKFIDTIKKINIFVHSNLGIGNYLNTKESKYYWGCHISTNSLIQNPDYVFRPQIDKDKYCIYFEHPVVSEVVLGYIKASNSLTLTEFTNYVNAKLQNNQERSYLPTEVKFQSTTPWKPLYDVLNVDIVFKKELTQSEIKIDDLDNTNYIPLVGHIQSDVVDCSIVIDDGKLKSTLTCKTPDTLNATNCEFHYDGSFLGEGGIAGVEELTKEGLIFDDSMITKLFCLRYPVLLQKYREVFATLEDSLTNSIELKHIEEVVFSTKFLDNSTESLPYEYQLKEELYNTLLLQ